MIRRRIKQVDNKTVIQLYYVTFVTAWQEVDFTSILAMMWFWYATWSPWNNNQIDPDITNKTRVRFSVQSTVEWTMNIPWLHVWVGSQQLQQGPSVRRCAGLSDRPGFYSWHTPLYTWSTTPSIPVDIIFTCACVHAKWNPPNFETRCHLADN